MKSALHNLWHALSMRCEEADRLRSLPDEDFPRLLRWGAAFHTVLCKSCRNAKRQLERLQSTLQGLEREPGVAVGLSPEARARIAKSIEEGV